MIYRAVLTLVFTAAAAFFVKTFIFDTVRMDGEQMAPTILEGDRLLIFRTPCIPIFSGLFKPPYDRPVVYSMGGKLGCLRVAAASGDTIRIDSARTITSRGAGKINSFAQKGAELVPDFYSPRDFFHNYRVPGKGDPLILNKLSKRDFFFAYSIIDQENPRRKVSVNPYVVLDDSVCRDYFLDDFAFYRGRIDSVPDSLRNSYLFWNSVEEYLSRKHEGGRACLYFTLSVDNITIDEYVVKRNYYFLLADNRIRGLDSRYFGPVCSSNCRGRVCMVLWSYGKSEKEKRRFRFNRLGRFIS